MATYTAGQTALIKVTLTDRLGNAITTAADSDFTESINHEASDGTITAATVGTWTHQGGGVYHGPISNAAAGKYSGTVRYTGTPFHLFTWDADVLTAAQADPAAALAATVTPARMAKLDILGTGRQVVVTSPVSADAQTLTLVQGDEYSANSGQPITFTEPDTGWPILTDATVQLIIRNRVGASVITDAGTVDVATGDAKQVSFALSGTQTGALEIGRDRYPFAVVATLSGGQDRTLVRGSVTVERDSAP